MVRALAACALVTLIVLAPGRAAAREPSDPPPTVPKAVHSALRTYVLAEGERKEASTLKKLTRLLRKDLALAAQAIRTLPPLTKARPGTKHGETFASGGQDWTYSIHLPKGYDGKVRFPVLVLPDHGSVSGEAGIQFWVGKPDAEKYILFRPVIAKHKGDRARFPDAQFFAIDQAMARVMGDALRHLRLHYAVDPNRLSMTGLSQGGYYTWYYALSFPDSFAAIIPESAGGMGLMANKALAPNARGMHIRLLHHPDDAITPYGHAVAMKKAVGGDNVELITYKDSDYPGEPFPKRHPGPHHLRLQHVLPWAHTHTRTRSASITRVLRYRQQGHEGSWRITPPAAVGQLFTVTCENKDGELSADHDGVWYRVPPSELLARTSFRVGKKRHKPKADLELLLGDFKSHGDCDRLVAAEIPVR